MSPAGGLTILHHLLEAAPAPPTEVADFGAWQADWPGIAAGWETPVDRALAGGLAADRPAWAFAAGYQAALQVLRPAAGVSETAALCITEEGGAHPARIRCRLTPDPANPVGFRLEGEKTFVTGAPGVAWLLVAASTGSTPEGKNRLRLARVAADAPGVTITPLPPLGFVPELPHGSVRFAGVRLEASDLLPGDGYLAAVKPFRTIEDLHVSAALLAWVFGVGRRAAWPGEALEALLACMALDRGLATQPPLAPHVHLAAGGLLNGVGDLLARLEPLWAQAPAADRERWQRDRRLLTIAAAARQRRLQAAWERYRR